MSLANEPLVLAAAIRSSRSLLDTLKIPRDVVPLVSAAENLRSQAFRDPNTAYHLNERFSEGRGAKSDGSLDKVIMIKVDNNSQRTNLWLWVHGIPYSFSQRASQGSKVAYMTNTCKVSFIDSVQNLPAQAVICGAIASVFKFIRSESSSLFERHDKSKGALEMYYDSGVSSSELTTTMTFVSTVEGYETRIYRPNSDFTDLIQLPEQKSLSDISFRTIPQRGVASVLLKLDSVKMQYKDASKDGVPLMRLSYFSKFKAIRVILLSSVSEPSKVADLCECGKGVSVLCPVCYIPYCCESCTGKVKCKCAAKTQ